MTISKNKLQNSRKEIDKIPGAQNLSPSKKHIKKKGIARAEGRKHECVENKPKRIIVVLLIWS